ncbi:MAG: FliH/SctL family protein [Alphaproteobacteria bacterium]|nr:FliH/SctL family protein [Alphaproteobacteria bacterium]
MATQPDTMCNDENRQARKFLFDVSFDKGMAAEEAAQQAPVTYSEEDFTAAQKQAYEAGLEEGKKILKEDEMNAMNKLLIRLDENLMRASQEVVARWQSQLGQLQSLALVIARKIMPTYIARHGMDEIESLVSRAISEMGREPRLVFRVPEPQFDEARTRINALVSQAAYAGKVVILGDPALGMSECRVEWADGGMERDVKKIWQDVGRLIGGAESAALLEQADQEELLQAQESTPPDPSDEDSNKGDA